MTITMLLQMPKLVTPMLLICLAIISCISAVPGLTSFFGTGCTEHSFYLETHSTVKQYTNVADCSSECHTLFSIKQDRLHNSARDDHCYSRGGVCVGLFKSSVIMNDCHCIMHIQVVRLKKGGYYGGADFQSWQGCDGESVLNRLLNAQNKELQLPLQWAPWFGRSGELLGEKSSGDQPCQLFDGDCICLNSQANQFCPADGRGLLQYMPPLDTPTLAILDFHNPGEQPNPAGETSG